MTGQSPVKELSEGQLKAFPGTSVRQKVLEAPVGIGDRQFVVGEIPRGHA